MNDNFDSEDSELKNLDWEEWETEDDEQHQQQQPPPSYFDMPDSSGKQSEMTDTDDTASIVVDILDMAQPVVSLEPSDHRQGCQSITDSEASFQTYDDDVSEPTYEELQSIKVDMIGRGKKRKRKLTIPFLDLPSPPSSSSSASSSSSGSITPTADEQFSSSISILSSTPHQDLSSSMSNETCHSFESLNTGGARRKQHFTDMDQSKQQSDPQVPKKRLAQFWERRVSGSFEQSPAPTAVTLAAGHTSMIEPNTSTDSISKFKPAIPSYYDPEGNRKANEKIQKFLEATRKAADDTGVSVWSSNYEKLKRGELSLPDYDEDYT